MLFNGGVRAVQRFGRRGKSDLFVSTCQATTSVHSEISGSTDPNNVADASKCPVSSYNEWDTLEEVIVGRPQGARVPKLLPEVKASIKPGNWDWFATRAGQAHEPERMQKAIQQSDEFCRVLELEGVKVRRPEVIDWEQKGDYKTPDFEEGGLHMACPRDSLIVIGNEIIEAPMSWRSRYFETRPFKTLLNDYFQAGARWTLAPKPTMSDELYRKDYPYHDVEKRIEWCKNGKFVLTENEPCFDAADVTRCGVDVFVQISHTTNFSGYTWLKRHLGDQYRVHALNIEDPYAFHIDASLIPLKPGLFLVNPERPIKQIESIKRSGWDVVFAPRPVQIENNVYCSNWLSMNTLSLDEERIICYSKEVNTAKFLEKLGMKPILVDFADCFVFGGAFHCWTVDIRRRGKLQSYFDW